MQYWLRIIVATVLLLCSQPASADLIIDIVGSPGSGLTTWTLSGNATALQNDTFESGTNLLEGDSWVDIGDLFNSGLNGSAQIDVAITGPSVSIAGVIYSLDRILLDDDAASSNDEVGFGIDSGSDVDFVAGDMISWTGSFTLSQDINSMNVGSYVDPSPSFGGLALQVNISAVPEPASFGVIAPAVLIGLYRRRRT